MSPVRGITAGGSRITFYGRHLQAVPDPLGAYFIPSNDTGLPPLYGFAYSRSEAYKLKSFLAQFARVTGARAWGKNDRPFCLIVGGDTVVSVSEMRISAFCRKTLIVKS